MALEEESVDTPQEPDLTGVSSRSLLVSVAYTFRMPYPRALFGRN